MVIVDDLIASDLTLLICGSAMGNVSAQKKAYYAHPQNRFWRNLYTVGLTPHQIEPQQYTSLLNYGIGLTDLCKQESGLDKELSRNAYDVQRLATLVERYQPAMLVFSALAPARAFMHGFFNVSKKNISTGHQSQTVGNTRVFICTSTSPLYPNQQRTLDLWRSLAQWVQEHH